jgi:hypothetical protein
MDVKNMTLEEFLLARIAEDERHARAVKLPLFGATHPVTIRALAECEAKRRIVDAYQHAVEYEAQFPNPDAAEAYIYEHVLQFLALPYADHPGFRQEWRP